MTDETQAAAPAAATDTSAQQAPTPALSPEDTAKWLPARLARKEMEIAKSLGADSIDELKARLAEAAEFKKSQLSEVEKLRAEAAELKNAAKERDEYKGAVSLQANAAMSALTEAQREAVLEAAGDSPVKQLRMIDKLKATWAPVAEAKKPVPAPASTAPVATAPAPAALGSENVLATYEALAKTNPVAAANYRLTNYNAYFEALNART